MIVFQNDRLKTTILKKTNFLKKLSFLKTIVSFSIFYRLFNNETIVFQKNEKVNIPRGNFKVRTDKKN